MPGMVFLAMLTWSRHSPFRRVAQILWSKMIGSAFSVARLGLWDKAFAFVALDETDRQIVGTASCCQLVHRSLHRFMAVEVLAFRGSETLTQLMVEILYHSLVPWKDDEKVRKTMKKPLL